MTFELKSSAFDAGDPIPVEYTCDGANGSPALSWGGAPQGVVSYVLVMDDPDAPVGTWDHWVIFNLPATLAGLEPGYQAGERSDTGVRDGVNSWGEPGYGGPCPPSGTHRYFFRLYALDAALELPDGVGKAELLEAMQVHTLAVAELMGTYTR